MHSRKHILPLVSAFALTLATGVAFAHNGIEHVMGTLSAKSDASVTVETPKHTKVTVLLDPGTTYSFNDKSVSFGDLKLGERVVVNAKEGKDEKLHSISIRWGANSTAHDDHKQ